MIETNDVFGVIIVDYMAQYEGKESARESGLAQSHDDLSLGRISGPNSPPPFHPHERKRLDAVHKYDPFVRANDASMASLAQQAAKACDASMGLVSLLDAAEQRMVGEFGIVIERADRCDTICAHTILQVDVLVVEDASLDPRFGNLPGVAGEPRIRFYAGAPILDDDGLPLGTVCAIDARPRAVSSRSLHHLQRLATLARSVLQARRLFAKPRPIHAPPFERKAADASFDALLLTFVEPRSSNG